MAKRPTSTTPPPPSEGAAERPQDAATGGPDAAVKAEGDGTEVSVPDLGLRLRSAVQAALDAMDEVARGTAFVVANPADAALVEAARHGFDAVRQAMADAEASIAKAVEMVQYRNLERRTFELVKDVELDGVRYGPSHELAHAAVTEKQHAELKAIGALDAEWTEEGFDRP